MKYFNNEEQIKHSLGIDSWRDLSKDRILRFVEMMPDMDRDVMLKIIDSIPEFTKFAVDALKTMEEAYSKTLAANAKSQSDVHKAFKEIRDILKNELKTDNLSHEDKKYLLDLIIETGNKESEKDSENKQFLKDMMDKAIQFGEILLIGVLIIYVGPVLLKTINNKSE